MKRTSVFLFFCLLLSLNACAFAPVNKPVVDRKKSVVLAEFDLSLENAKALVEKTYDIMGYQKAREEQKSGGFMLSTNDKAMPSVGNCDCGTWNGSKIQGTISSAIITALEPISAEKTIVRVMVIYATTFTARNLYGAITRQEVVKCQSTGKKESQFIEIMTRKADEAKQQNGGAASKVSPTAEQDFSTGAGSRLELPDEMKSW